MNINAAMVRPGEENGQRGKEVGAFPKDRGEETEERRNALRKEG